MWRAEEKRIQITEGRQQQRHVGVNVFMSNVACAGQKASAGDGERRGKKRGLN